MRVLVACEYSGRIRNAFTARGHYAVSCDILPSITPGLHYQGDILKMPGVASFDLLIANVPCTHLSAAGSKLWELKQNDGRQLAAYNFVMSVANLPINKICIENPTGYLNTHWRKPDQIIHPYYFDTDGTEYVMKRTCLWFKNLNKLTHLNNLPKPEPISVYKSGAKQGKAIHFTANAHGWKQRSLTFKCIARAMADQWG